MELAQTGVKVSCIEPGIVDTALCDHFENPPKQVFNITHALAPDDVARCIRFILEQPDHVLIPKLMVMPSEQGL
jgi:NADP-dependent 3-hydroxy acid dehydrogenase YdfG